MGCVRLDFCFKGFDDFSVERVSWNDLRVFITKLNQKSGQRFCLPTKAEWEYAAREGNKSKCYKYSGSNTLNNVGWCGLSGRNSNSGRMTHPVGQKNANELSIYDMSGNVWEWCSDWYGDYSSGSQTNPTGSSSGSHRVLRGGSWQNYANYCCVSIRGFISPDYHGNDIGFRLALDQ